MGEVAVTIFKWVFRAGLILAGITALLAVLNFAFSLIFIQLNDNVLSDLFAMVQIWLPFNLNSLLAWLIVASISYTGYRLAVVGINYMSRFTAA